MRQIIGRQSLLCLLALSFVSYPVSGQDDWMWTQSDWSGAQYGSVDAIDAEIEPGELVLENDPNRLVFAFDPSHFAGVWALRQWAGRLYLGAGQYPTQANGGDILVYDYATDSVALDYSVFEQGICVLKDHAGVLYSPGVDSQGSWEFGNLYYNDGGGWVRKETVPNAVHVFDVAFWDDRIWVTAPTALPNSPAVLYASDDMGDTWTEEFRVETVPPDTFRRLWGMTSWNGSLFVQGDGKAPEGPVIYEFNGSDPVVHSLPAMGNDFLSGFVPFQNRLACLTRSRVFFYDGKNWSSVVVLPGSNLFCRAIGVYQERLYVGGNGEFFASSDGETWERYDGSAFAGREIESWAQHHGRLYAGIYDYELKRNEMVVEDDPECLPFASEVTGDGDVFVTPAVAEGSLVSLPHTFPGPVGGGTISWEGLVPSVETTVSFQLRSAMTVEALPMEPFLGPDGSPGSWYETSGAPISNAHWGHCHFQYRVRLRTQQDRLAPVLTDFVLDVDEMTTDVSAESPAARTRLAAWPNPFHTDLSIGLFGVGAVFDASHQSGLLCIFDVRGRLVRELPILEPNDPVCWDGRDASGVVVCAGVYNLEWRGVGPSPMHARIVKIR